MGQLVKQAGHKNYRYGAVRARLRGLALTLLLIMLAPIAAYAACTSPAGVAGNMGFNLTGTNDFEYCDGTNWVSMDIADVAGGSSCPGDGTDMIVGTVASAGPAIASPDPLASNMFGDSVAASGSITVVGEPGCKCSLKGQNNDEGVAYVYDTASGNLTATLSNPDPEANDRFGEAVATDGTTVVVGAWRDNSQYGEAYIFDTSGNHLHTLPTPNSYGTRFGYDVAVDGNLVVVSAPAFSSGPLGDGAVYIYDKTTGNLIRTLNNPAPASSDNFGERVAIYGTTVVIGVSSDDPGGVSNAGTVYVFDTTSGNLQATLNNPTTDINTYFGRSVAIDATTIVVGAIGDKAGSPTQTGAVHVFDTTTYNHVVTLSDPTTPTLDQFGANVAVSGNIAVVSAQQTNVGGVSNVGTVYVFDKTTGDLLVTLNNPDPTLSDQFGISASISGSTVVVGTSWDDPGGISNAGSVYTFNLASAEGLMSILSNPNPVGGGDQFGKIVAVSGNRAVIGTITDQAYVFDTATGNLLATLNNPDPTASDFFGRGVAISGTTVAIGASGDDPGGIMNAGTVYIFDATTGSLTSTINNPNPASGDNFGSSVAIQ